jgi:hypothetical protein
MTLSFLWRIRVSLPTVAIHAAGGELHLHTHYRVDAGLNNAFASEARLSLPRRQG